jgi:hypothetical protein
LSPFELRMLPDQTRESPNVFSDADVGRLAGAAFVVSTDAISRYVEPGSTAGLAEWAESAADNVARDRPLPPSPVGTTSLPTTGIEPDARISLRAIEQLESEVQHVASARH